MLSILGLTSRNTLVQIFTKNNVFENFHSLCLSEIGSFLAVKEFEGCNRLHNEDARLPADKVGRYSII